MIILFDAVRLIRNSFYQSYISINRSPLHASSIDPCEPLLYVIMSGDTESRKKQKLTDNLESVEKQLELLRKVRGKPSLLKEEKLDILFVYFSIYRESLRSGVYAGPVNAVSRTATLLSRGKGTVSSTIKKWTDDYFLESRNIDSLRNSIASNHRKRYTKSHYTNISDAQIVYLEVRDFVRSKRSKLERITATDVFHFLKLNNFIVIHSTATSPDLNISFKSSLRTVKRWLNKKRVLKEELSQEMLG